MNQSPNEADGLRYLRGERIADLRSTPQSLMFIGDRQRVSVAVATAALSTWPPEALIPTNRDARRRRCGVCNNSGTSRPHRHYSWLQNVRFHGMLTPTSPAIKDRRSEWDE